MLPCLFRSVPLAEMLQTEKVSVWTYVYVVFTVSYPCVWHKAQRRSPQRRLLNISQHSPGVGKPSWCHGNASGIGRSVTRQADTGWWHADRMNSCGKRIQQVLQQKKKCYNLMLGLFDITLYAEKLIIMGITQWPLGGQTFPFHYDHLNWLRRPWCHCQLSERTEIKTLFTSHYLTGTLNCWAAVKLYCHIYNQKICVFISISWCNAPDEQTLSFYNRVVSRRWYPP